MTLTQRTKIFKKCSEKSLNIYILDLLNEGFFSTASQVRKIEIEDLLGRKEIQFDKKIAPNFFNSTILITGAGGSIGSELVFQIIYNF